MYSAYWLMPHSTTEAPASSRMMRKAGLRTGCEVMVLSPLALCRPELGRSLHGPSGWFPIS